MKGRKILQYLIVVSIVRIADSSQFQFFNILANKPLIRLDRYSLLKDKEFGNSQRDSLGLHKKITVLFFTNHCSFNVVDAPERIFTITLPSKKEAPSNVWGSFTPGLLTKTCLERHLEKITQRCRAFDSTADQFQREAAATYLARKVTFSAQCLNTSIQQCLSTRS